MNRNSSHDAPAKLLSRRKGAAPVSTTPKSTFSNQSAVFSQAGEGASSPSAAASTLTNGAGVANAPSAFGNTSWKPAASTTSASRPIGAAFAAAEASASSSAMPSYLFAPGAGDPDPPSSSSPAPSIGQQGSGLGRFMRSRESPGPSTISGQRNALGGMVETDAERKKRFDKDTVGSAIRFQELKEQREAMRERYIRQGVLPDDTKAQDLAATQTLRGTCMEMCSEFERVEREVQKEADPPELYPGTEKIDPRLAVKIYRRPAAGRELPLPDDVRPPAVLRRTLDYLFHTLLPTDPSSTEFAQVQGFIWNRTRAVRQDFIVQGQGGPMTIECHERIARYHILCLHWKGGRGAEEWSEQQEMEQLRKTIRSLSEFYADLRALTGKSAPNEAEFRAYELLLHHRDPDTLREIERLPPIIFDSPTLQTALRLRGLAQGAGPDKPRDGSEGSLNLWTRFFAETKKARVPYLLACLAETIIPTVRAGALRAMSSAYMAQHPPLPVQDLTNDLSFDSQEEALEFARNRGIGEQWTTEESGKKTLAVRIDNKTERALVSDVQLERSKAVPFSQIVVESKRQRWSCRDIIDGVASGATPLLNHDGGQPLPAPFHPARQPSAAPTVPSRQSATPVTDHWNAPTSRKAALPPPVISRPVQPYSAPVAATSAFDNSSSGSIWGASQLQSRLGGVQTDLVSLASESQFGSTPTPFRASTSAAARSSAHPYTKPSSSSSSFSFPSNTSSITAPFSTAPGNATSTMMGQSTKTASSASIPSAFPAPAAAVTAGAASLRATELPSGLATAAVVPQASNAQVVSGKRRKASDSFVSSPSPSSPSHGKQREASNMQSARADVAPLPVVRSLREEKGEACAALDARSPSGRRECIQFAAETLFDRALGEVLSSDLDLDELAQQGAADAFRDWNIAQNAWDLWLGRHDSVVEMAKQAERLEAVRAKLRSSRLGHDGADADAEMTDKARSSSRHLLGDRHAARQREQDLQTLSPVTIRAGKKDDDTISDGLVVAQADREDLWEPGTFFDIVATYVEAITTPALRRWRSVLVTQTSDSASEWLVRKLMLPGNLDESISQTTLSDSSGTQVELAHTTLPRKSAVIASRDVALVIFASSSAETQSDEAALEVVEGALVNARGRFAPHMLMLRWGSAAPSVAELRPAQIRKREDAFGTRIWSNVQEVRLEGSLEQLESAFGNGLDELLRFIPWRKQSASQSDAREVLSALWTPLAAAAQATDSCLRHLLEDKLVTAATPRVSAETAARVFDLLWHTINAVSRIASRLWEDDENGTENDLLVLPSDVAKLLPEDTLPLQLLLEAARESYAELGIMEDVTLPFSVVRFVEQVFQGIMERMILKCDDGMLRPKNELLSAIARAEEVAAKSINAIAAEDRAWIDLARVRQMSTSEASSLQPVADRPMKQASAALPSAMITSSKRSPSESSSRSSVAKRAKIVRPSRASPTSSEAAPRHAVATLRELMSNAETFLETKPVDESFA